MRHLKLALASALLVSSCATAPTNSITSGATTAGESARYKVFTLEKECPQTCNAARGTGRGVMGNQQEFEFSYRAVDRQPGPDLLDVSFTLDGIVYTASSGTVTFDLPNDRVDISATVDSGSGSLELHITQFGDFGDSDVFVTGIDAGSGSGEFDIFEGQCELPAPFPS